MVPPWKVSLRLSQSGRALPRARDAVVLWHDTSATPATPTDRYTNHNSLLRLSEMLVAARNISAVLG